MIWPYRTYVAFNPARVIRCASVLALGNGNYFVFEPLFPRLYYWVKRNFGG